MYKKLVVLIAVLFLSVGSLFAGGPSLKQSRDSLASFKSGEEYIDYIDSFLESASRERLEEIYYRALNANLDTELQSKLTKELSAILGYVHLKAYYELNPDLYSRNAATINTNAIEAGDLISVHYEGRLEDGTIFDSSYDRGQTLEFTTSAGQMIPGFDAAVLGMKVGEKKTITLPPSEAYGERSDVFQEILKSDLQSFVDAGFKLDYGEILPTQFGEFEIIGVTDDAVHLDTNHPFAGKTLIFDIEIIEIK